MRRLLRILVNVVTALSLLLCAATVTAWFRSYRSDHRAEWLGWRGFRQYDICWERGLVFMMSSQKWAGAPGRESPVPLHAHRRWVHEYDWAFLAWGRYYGTIDSPGRGIFQTSLDVPDYHEFIRHHEIKMPLWWLFAAFLLTPSVRLGRRTYRRVRDAHRSRSNCCPACGYDLRATPDRCPECGAIPPVVQQPETPAQR